MIGIILLTLFYYIMQYFNDARQLKPERLKALRIQWAKYYLKVKNETQDVQAIL